MDFLVAVLFSEVLLPFANLIWRSLQANWSGFSVPREKKACLPKCDLTYFFVQLRFDSITYRLHKTTVQLKVTCLYRWLPDSKTKHSWLTNDYWLLLRNFAPVLVWNFYPDCLTNCERRMAFAVKLCTSSGVKLLRWLPDWLPTTTGFCCETLHAWLTA